MRADNAAIHAGHQMEPLVIKSPAQEMRDQIDTEKKNAIRAGIMAQLKRPIPKTE